MAYRVRTPDGELMFPSLGDIERAYVQGLVDPDDEVREDGSEKWRKASSLPVLAHARRPQAAKDSRAQTLTVLGAVAVGVFALVLLVMGSSWNVRMLGIALALVVSGMLTRVTFKAYKRPPPVP
ncbi:hypothetical protein D7Y13_01015 [Corallococcus praedator]|uniref:GYF domain-containing protein n=1 Tax=Corallococcus praedator TaxID=2316724 RepID=A0ABX9QR55_9BACT|nr:MULTISPECIES: hypothetical protein [Corallococcus]RKH21387.1 hypothetical protein D7X74_01525 [Corallococcus sp. CA047B]RKH35039.1 hypothetical protein D7X75_05765 [Corallococcus sp. CA031C]RKI17323.1 hypothetical protein D7Y13_01015 [Corallococcus praedator]